MNGKFSKFCFDVVENNSSSWFGKFLGNSISFLIVANVLAVAIETLPAMNEFKGYFYLFEIFSVIIFTIEYSIRVWTARYKEEFSGKNGRIQYACTPFMVFDFFVIFPALLSVLGLNFFDTRILRIVRVLRIFRLQQYSASLRQIFRVIAVHKEILLSAFVLVFMGVMIVSTLMYHAENKAQPEVFSSIPAAMYWGVITMATIGYGDVTPITHAGKIIAVLTALIGVGIYSLPTAILGAAFYAEAQSKEAKKILLLEQKIGRMKKRIEYYEEKEKYESLENNKDDHPHLKNTAKRWRDLLPFQN